MRPHLAGSLAAVTLATALVTWSAGAPLAAAQTVRPADTSDSQRGLPAPARALELTVASGYAQGFGTLQPGVAMPEVAKAGIGVDASVGYRIAPHYAVSFGGAYQQLEADRYDAVRGFAFDIALQYHVAPLHRVDPWLELASGYRMLWLVPFAQAPTTLVHGPELVRIRAGLDLRISPEVAVAPVIGADATMFAFREDETTHAISEPTLSTFVFAGIQGRLDIGGVRSVTHVEE